MERQLLQSLKDVFFLFHVLHVRKNCDIVQLPSPTYCLPEVFLNLS